MHSGLGRPVLTQNRKFRALALEAMGSFLGSTIFDREPAGIRCGARVLAAEGIPANKPKIQSNFEVKRP